MSSAAKSALSRARSPWMASMRRPGPLQARTAHTSTARPEPSRPAGSDPQALPRGRYYDILLTDPPPYARRKPEQPPVSAAASPSPSPSPSSPLPEAKVDPAAPPTADSVAEKARIVFGSPLAGPAARAQRLRDLRSKGTVVAGVLVPPKPQEPDHCCMSGCVNCVWDAFREDMEEWAAATAEAERRLAAAKSTAAAAAPATSMDDDGGGSQANWDADVAPPPPPPLADGKIAKDLWSDELYQNVPVGIREFMKQEKRLKEKHKREGTQGG